MDSNEQNSVQHEFILVPDTRFGYVPSTSVTPNSSMAQQEADLGLNKKWWNHANTKLLINEFKKYYQLWKIGSINKKKTMWQKVAAALKNKGLSCTAEQVENRYKTLQRGYRKSNGIIPRTRNRRAFKYENELSDIMNYDMTIIDENPLIDEASPECVDDQESAEDDSHDDNFTHFEEVNLEEPATTSNSTYTRRPVPRVKYRIPRKRPAKTSVDVLMEIKELMKKVELRRQIRHEQNLKVAMEKNEILKRKNQLMELMLKNN